MLSFRNRIANQPHMIMARERSLQVGLISHENESWIAGVLYVQTVMRAMAALPDCHQVDLHLWMRRGSDAALHEPFESLIRSSRFYDALCHGGFADALKHHQRAIMRHGCLSRNLVDQAIRSGMDLLFPCHKSLGPDAGIPWIGWIPDFQHLHLPELFSREARERRERTYAGMIRDSSHMVVSSDAALHDLLETYEVSKAKVSVYRFRTCSDPSWFLGDPAEVARKHGLPDKFLIFPSQSWRHKDHLVLFDALSRLKESGIRVKLVLTGNDRDYRHPDHAPMLHDYLDRHGLNEQVCHLGLLPRHEQIQLMRRACAVVQPSRFEGWSMLVEDCRALGKTVILSDIAVHREQAYERTNYFTTGDAQSLAEVVAREWPGMEPGPDEVSERGARTENARLTRENGFMLHELFKGVAGREGS